MVYHFDDFPNPWDAYAAGEDTGDDAADVAVTVRFAIRGPAAAVAAAADAFPRASAKNAHFATGFEGFVPPDVHHSVASSALGAAASYDAAAATKRASSSSSRRLSAASYAVAAFGVASAIAAVARDEARDEARGRRDPPVPPRRAARLRRGVTRVEDELRHRKRATGGETRRTIINGEG